MNRRIGPPNRITVRALLGRVVHDVDGERVGKIEEMRAVQVDEHLEIREYVVGAHGALLRVAARPVLRWMLEYFGVSGWRDHTIPWDWLDVSDPAHPRLLRPHAALHAIHSEPPPGDGSP